MDRNLLFALDIGTRSVVGLIGEQTEKGIAVLAMERQEHNTRAMLDGQIHDVPEVAQVLDRVKAALEIKVGPLRKVSVAAAGRALCTVTVEAEIDCSTRGALTEDDERALELAGIQVAQKKLATSKSVADPAAYYCVGYNVVRYILDGTSFKSLVGQRGKTARIELIGTFLPRQVIDSLQSAIFTVDLEIATLTLEPIAAINVLIPQTMRHLNLALVDVGAGTSDVAITREGSVVGFGMVPFAGDEVTEAISQAYLLDFTVAEALKRKVGGKNKSLTFTDVLGLSHKVSADEITERIRPTVGELAQAIATQILSLNTTPPQAVLLVGGGSLTPLLPEAVAQALDIAPTRVAIRRPDSIDGLKNIPASLCAPDGVTPLGILRLAGSRTLNFLQVTLNGQPVRMFNLGKLTVADALLVAGIEVRGFHGRPGLGITITVNGEKRFLPGTAGQAGQIKVNSADASFSHQLEEGDVIFISKGTAGSSPEPKVSELTEIPQPITIMLDDNLYTLGPIITINDKPATADSRLADRDELVCRPPKTLGEALALAGISSDSREFRYVVNGVERVFSRFLEYSINHSKATPVSIIRDNDIVVTIPVQPPTYAELLGINPAIQSECALYFNSQPCKVPLRRNTLTVGGRPASLSQVALPDAGDIEFFSSEIQPTVSDVLLAAEFNPLNLPRSGRVAVVVNGQPAEYTTYVKNNDSVEIRVVLGSS